MTKAQEKPIEPAEMTTPSRGGAPAGNANHFSSGLRGSLTLGGVPKKCSYIRKIAGRFRREVEMAALDVHGTLGLYQLALAQSSTRHELRCLYAMRALRDADDTLPLADRLRLMDTLGAASDARDKVLRLLGLDKRPEAHDPWAVIDNPTSTPQAAPQALVGPDGQAATEAPHDAPGAALDPAAANGAPAPAWQAAPDGMHETSTSGTADQGDHETSVLPNRPPMEKDQ